MFYQKFTKNVFFTLLLISIAQASYAQAGNTQILRQIKDYYDNSREQVKQIYHVKQAGKNTVSEGDFTSFYQNGNIKMKGDYKDNSPQGEWSYFYESGELKSKGNYENGKKVGKWTFYYENQNIQSEGNFENDQKQDKWKNYYENGTLKSIGDLCDSKFCGTWKYYYEDGNAKATTYYNKKGNALHELYHVNGGIKAVGWLKNEKSDSVWRYYDEDGKLTAIGQEKDGKRIGEWKFFHKDSSVSAIGSYDKGTPQGNWQYFHENGNVKSVGTYEKGAKNGTWRTFYTDGKLESSAEFNQGNGDYNEYYEDGKIKVAGKYENGKKQGIWKYYEQDGKLFADCEFQQGTGNYKGYHEDGSLRTKGVIEDDKKIGTWELYHPDGSLAGYYKPYYENEKNPEIEKDTLKQITPTVINIDTLPKGKITYVMPKKKSRYFKRTHSDKRYLLIGTNPLAPLFNFIPINIEYYVNEKMGYVANIQWYKRPFFTKKEPAVNQLEEQSISIDFIHKFYHPDNGAGSLYFGYEIRAKETAFATSAIIDSIPSNRKIVNAKETAAEFLVVGGDKLLNEWGKRKHFSFDVMLGLGAGYRHQRVEEDMPNFPEFRGGKVYVAYRIAVILAVAL